MMKLTGSLLLLGILTIIFTSVRAGEHAEGTEWKQTFRDEGVSEEEIAWFEEELDTAAIAIAAAGDGRNVSWREARGYEECNSTEFQGENEDKPMTAEKSCDLYECPEYEALNSTGCGFGVRIIKGAKWASTEIELDDMSDIEGSIMSAYIRLFKYIRGANYQGAKIDRTIPLIFKWYTNFEETYATMHFYIPAEFQENTPYPHDEAVYIEEWIDSVLYHRTFGGDDRVDIEIYMREFENLRTALENENVDFYPHIAITGTFTEHSGRQRHEVMFLEWSW